MATSLQDRVVSRDPTRSAIRVGRTAMVAAANPIATLIGVEVLRSGGNAIDASIAIGAAMAVLQPDLSHVGGDLFLQYWDASNRCVHALNASGAAPTNATIEAMGDGIPFRGIRSAAVPGAPDGWLTALQTWGTMSAWDVFAPSILLAEDGHVLTSGQIDILRNHEDLLREYPNSAKALVPENLTTGSVRSQPELARTIRDLAEGGRDAFYSGVFADKLVEYSDANNGFFTREDLAGHRSHVMDPIRTTYRGVTVTEQPPVSQGLILLEILNILEGFDLGGMDPGSSDLIHIMAEAKKLAFADRMAYMGDIPKTPLLQLLQKEHSNRRRHEIDLKSAAAFYPPGKLRRSHGSDTTSYCVVDSRGNAVTAIQSVFHAFGSGVVVPGTGVLLNNRMTGFSMDPENPNALAPGKRTMHTLNTFMLFKDDKLWVAGGSPGGHVQVQTNAQLVVQMVDFGDNPQQAIETPKWHVTEEGPSLVVEDRVPLDVCYELRQRGHQLVVNGPWSGSCSCQVIEVDPATGVLYGGSDPRKDGLALGY